MFSLCHDLWVAVVLEEGWYKLLIAVGRDGRLELYSFDNEASDIALGPMECNSQAGHQPIPQILQTTLAFTYL